VLREALRDEGLDVPDDCETQIVPLVVGAADATMRACEAALGQGVFAQGIRPPTVPVGTSRLRLAVMASHTKSELRWAAGVLARALEAADERPRRSEPAPVPARSASGTRLFDGVAEAA
jgi:7-keto-8-aminopelargonate synthetase-like enzyme